MSINIYNEINQLYNSLLYNNNNEYKLNTLKILLDLINNIDDNKFKIIYNKYIINFKTTDINSLYYGIYIFDTIESFISFLRCSTDIKLFNELSNFLKKLNL
jgi:hypothetical protein